MRVCKYNKKQCNNNLSLVHYFKHFFIVKDGRFTIILPNSTFFYRGSSTEPFTNTGDDVFLYIRPDWHLWLPAALEHPPRLVSGADKNSVWYLHDRGCDCPHQPVDCYDVRHVPAYPGMLYNPDTAAEIFMKMLFPIIRWLRLKCILVTFNWELY